MNLVFVINDNYVEQLIVALFSIKKNTVCNDINAYVLENDLTEDHILKLQEFAKKININITFEHIDNSIFLNLPTMRNDKTMTAYFKLLIANKFKFLDKILYLDCDLICQGDILELYNLETNKFISGVIDKKINKMNNHKEQIGMLANFDYINTGVLLYDFNNISDKDLNAYISKYSNVIKWHDQDIINGLYYDSIGYLIDKFNKLVISLNPFRTLSLNKAIILHFANWKPWNSNYIGFKKKQYYRYYQEAQKVIELSFYNKSKFKDKIVFFCNLLRRKLCKKF